MMKRTKAPCSLPRVAARVPTDNVANPLPLGPQPVRVCIQMPVRGRHRVPNPKDRPPAHKHKPTAHARTRIPIQAWMQTREHMRLHTQVHTQLVHARQNGPCKKDNKAVEAKKGRPKGTEGEGSEAGARRGRAKP